MIDKSIVLDPLRQSIGEIDQCDRSIASNGMHWIYQVIAYEWQITPKRGVVRVTCLILNFEGRNHISGKAKLESLPSWLNDWAFLAMLGQTVGSVWSILVQQGSPFPWQQPTDYMLVHNEQSPSVLPAVPANSIRLLLTFIIQPVSVLACTYRMYCVHVKAARKSKPMLEMHGKAQHIACQCKHSR